MIMKKEVEEEEDKPDQLTQLVTTFSRKATTESTGSNAGEDTLYMNYAEIMAKSCGEEEEEGGDDEGGGDEGGPDDPAASINVRYLLLPPFTINYPT